MTNLYGVLGNPIEHSMSPLMHNDAFQQNGIEAIYLPFRVETTSLEDAVKGLKALGARGWNVTVPHKQAIIPFLDKVDEFALASGAVNTVVNEKGRLIGYNTDGPGFVKGLKEELKQDIKTKRVLIIGAGGAARGIYFALAREGVKKIDITNRTPKRAEELAIMNPYPITETNVYTLLEAEHRLDQYDILVQTTTIGMYPNTNSAPIPFQARKELPFVCDIIYNPLRTHFLKQAEISGARVQNGIDMFVNQGALAFALWTGQEPDTVRMKQLVLQQLGG